MPSVIASRGTVPVASDKVQDFPKGMTPPDRSPGLGVD
jgi:hypothetical protein